VDETGMTEICVMSSTAEMHMTGLKTGARSMNALNRSSVKIGTMTTMVPIMINLTDSFLPKEGAMQEESKVIPTTQRGCVGPWTSNRWGSRNMLGPPTQLSGSRCISSPSRTLVGTHTSWQIICQSACHHPLGPSSSGFPRGRFIPGASCAGCSPVTFAPCVHIRELTGT
jgi:hypothetical protein